MLSVCAAVGQIIIYHTIRNFGALVCSTIMTTRQFTSLLISSAFFFSPITKMQWFGVIIVFVALYYEGLIPISFFCSVLFLILFFPL